MKFENGFPKVMHHPSFRAAELGFNPGEGRPVQFAPITVNTPEQQEYYESKGYRVPGTASVYHFQEYPKWVNGKIVNSADEITAAPPIVKRKPGRPRKVAA